MSSIKEKIAAARQKIQESKGRGSGKENFYLKSGEPKQIRLLPDIRDGKFSLSELPMIECVIWNIPGATKDAVLDPESVGAGESPMRKLHNELRQDKDESTKALLQWFKPKTRWFMRLLERKLDSAGKLVEDEAAMAKWFYAPMDISEEILRLLDDEEYGTIIMDPTEGLDFTFEKTGKGIETEYSAVVRRKPSPLHHSKKVIESLQELPSLSDKLASMLHPEDELTDLLSKMSMEGTKQGASKEAGGSKMKRREMEEKDADIEEKEEGDKPSSSALRERMKSRLGK